jgi:anion-transporting  ArsA/GET3 family ATPase
VSARLHVLLGQGGVGKTTLACAYALALAQGRRVGLLGVDPAGRLRTALGLSALGEEPAPLAGEPALSAAWLRPGESLRRWALEECRDGEARERLLSNPFFLALADRLAGATDALAAIRMAEWAERDPRLDELVLDTAPGLHGLELLRKPEKLLSLLDGKLLRWVSTVAVRRRPESAVARRILRGLSKIGGARVLLDLAEFSLLVQGVAASMIERLKRAREWLRRSDTQLVLVCVPRPDAAAGVRRLAHALRDLGLTPGPVVLNHALPATLSALAPEPGCAEARAFARFVRGSAALKARVSRELAPVVELPIQPGLDAAGPARLAALRQLGERLRVLLDQPLSARPAGDWG